MKVSELKKVLKRDCCAEMIEVFIGQQWNATIEAGSKIIDMLDDYDIKNISTTQTLTKSGETVSCLSLTLEKEKKIFRTEELSMCGDVEAVKAKEEYPTPASMHRNTYGENIYVK